MTAYFSFRKLITPYFVRTIYTIGFAALTAGGIGWAVWAGMRLNAATLPTRLGVYYIAIGAGILIVGNLVWRMICEFWLLLFNVHGLLTSIEKNVRHESIEPVAVRQVISEDAKSQRIRSEQKAPSVAPQRSVLGLSS